METSNLLGLALDGDIDAFERLATNVPVRWPQDAIDSPPVLTARGVRSVLEGLKAGTISPKSAERWAGFVRWGEFGEWAVTTSTARRDTRTPLHIEYQSAHEDGIIEAIAVLDESGEDGPIPGHRLDELLAAL